ncbi:MAG: cyclase family protein [Anaerolineaceae bacterium]|nr:cyclase family protein [Anaerolineaceae bacterium]
MKIYDISVLVNEKLLVWPDDPPVELIQAASIENGDGYNLNRLKISAHIGTHIDAPLHFFEQGKNIGSIALETLIGPVQVVEIPAEIQRINSKIIDQLNIKHDVKRLIFKTENSKLWGRTQDFYESYTALDTSGAGRIVELGITLVGIDYLSISIFSEITKPHMILLSKDIVILEGCDLSDVPAGEYQLICLPLKVNEIEGAPVRAVLITEE